MKAVICTQYGAPDVLQIRDIPKPAPKPNEVLIRIHAATVTPSDSAFRKGDPFIIRLIYGLRKPRLATQGVEFAGEIEAVGGSVTRFRPGERVFGMSPDRFGAQAEYLSLAEDKPLTTRSESLSAEEAVGICDGATTALIFLRDVAKLRSGQRILINGASGAVGAYAVQLAKHYGAHVTGVCSGGNAQLVRALGADEVIDYTREDFTTLGMTYDVIFDAVGKSSYGKCQRALTRDGLYMTTVPSLGIVLRMAWTSLFSRRKAKFVTAGLMQNHDNLAFLNTLANSGALRAVIDRCYPLDEVVEAHRYVETGRKKGNVILQVMQPADR
jgi:NADPH:quinone reductase-like Zn-dependent oxidoreductase